MGYGVPAAVGIKRLYPERTVVCFAGDGDFLMNGQEFATAVQYELPIIVVIVRQRHLRHHPHAPGARISRPRGRRPSCAIRISPPTRKAFGGFGVTVEKTADFAAAFAAAEESGKPAIIHLKVDTNASTPGLTLEAIRAKSLAVRG